MSGTREVGRYNLHRLGWSAFEDLSMQIMRVVLGETCTRFLPGTDGGRDGWFRGVATELLLTQSRLEGAFVVQCKHTSKAHDALTKSDLADEVKKVKQLAAAAPLNYVLVTNRRVSALSESNIRRAFESITGVSKCLVLAEQWIEDTIDSEPRLLRLVPRLYGIGDLSQILSSTVEKQTIALLEELARSLRTFVPTESYRRAEEALHRHRFVVLVGPPASGKSAIAGNLCMVTRAQNADVRVLRIEQASQFKETWSPADKNTMYWVDDVFGETTLDETRLHEWSAAIDMIETARKIGSRIIFCTRDYILAAACKRLKASKVDAIDDARVKVNVTQLTLQERESILYNHIKDGDIPKERKQALKPHLPLLATRHSFTPELARRLGSERFTKGLALNGLSLQAFFDQPVDHLGDVLHGLAAGETAAITVCLLNNNAVPDPVPEDAAPGDFLREYGVTLKAVRESLEHLEGSLVKRVRTGTSQTWQVHHPTMIEALQRMLASTPSQMAIYLRAAKLQAILRDTTTIPPDENSRLVFLPDATYPQLAARLAGAAVSETLVGRYLVDRASDGLLRHLAATHPCVIDNVLSVCPTPPEPDLAPRLAVRLSAALPESLLTPGRRDAVVESVGEGAQRHGCFGFLDVERFEDVAREGVVEILRRQVKNGFPCFDKLFDYHVEGVDSSASANSALEAIDTLSLSLQAALPSFKLLSDGAFAELTDQHKHYDALLKEKLAKIERAEDAQADMDGDYSRERWHEERYEAENGKFRDVDE